MYLILSLLLLLSSPALANTRDGLQGWWALDEASGSAIDSSKNGYTGTATGTTVVKNCPKGDCRSFNGSSDKIVTGTTADSFDTLSGYWTWNIWVKPNFNPATLDTSVDVIAYGGNDPRAMLQWANIALGWYADVVSGGTGSAWSTGNFSFTQNTWHMLTFMHTADGSNGGLGQFYWDGVSVSTTKNTENPVVASGIPLNIGYLAANSGYWTGQMDDVRVYNRNLSLQELKDLYNSGMKINNAPGT